MFALYKKKQEKDGTFYEFSEKIHLFGCNVGYIPKMLTSKLKSTDTEPHKWELTIEDELKKTGEDSKTIIIDIKPNNKEFILICELTGVCGYSSYGWTPALFKLRGLIIDEPIASYDKKEFKIEDSKEIPYIRTCTSFDGTVIKGAISGKWAATLPRSTNSVLIWPEVWKYFVNCA